jgi:hypothetical protein
MCMCMCKCVHACVCVCVHQAVTDFLTDLYTTPQGT